ncbi:uncharacterized protein LOC124460815 [Drosophila willistoni]|uniref:uncharacterized protein LOC124460815 n=1 Tax=Drosophila willistoni TaxID=7260 RepID=UPI001F083D6C|nr:uncharacterized protein LOC124460815 [Drosophila willistoni]
MDQKPQQQQNRIQQASSGTSPVSFLKDMSLIYRIYQQCTGENMSVCQKHSPDNKQRSKLTSISEQDIEAVLPRGVHAKEQVLNSMIVKRVGNFLQDHTLQIKFPDLRDTYSNSVEGRKKTDKKGSGTFVPIAYGA